MKATINNTAPMSTRNFEIGDIVIDNNDGHVVIVTETFHGKRSFSGLTIVRSSRYEVAHMCDGIDADFFELFVGTITLENMK